MAKQKLTAGAELDILTAAEMRSLLREWMVDVARGARPVKISTQGTADGSKLITMGGATTLTGGTLGPAAGFWWAVTRLALRVDGDPSAFSVFLGAANPNALVRDVGPAGYAEFGDHTLLLGNTDALVIQATGATASTSGATLTGSAVEFPEQLLWKWMVG